MATKTTSAGLFSPDLVKDVFSKVKGHSTLVKLSEQIPVPFSGTDVMTFNLDGECAIVGEGEQKPAGNATHGKVSITPNLRDQGRGQACL